MGSDTTGEPKGEKPADSENKPPVTSKETEAKPEAKGPVEIPQDKDGIRKIIKFTPEESSTGEKKGEKPAQAPPEKADASKKTKEAQSAEPSSGSGDSTSSREELEQRRQILQNMKEFDFQIKKNKEDITSLKDKNDALSKDLDDLVSLYEIVSEQMNPFVGLSKVTKKRLDALENFTKEVDTMKTRIGDLEAVLEKNSVLISNIEQNAQQEPRMMVPGEQGLSIDDIDHILEASLESLSVDQKVDDIMDEFIKSLSK